MNSFSRLSLVLFAVAGIGSLRAEKIVLVRKGVFGRAQQGETLVADPNHVLFFNAGEPYRYCEVGSDT